MRIEEVQQRWCFSLAASAFWGWRLPFSGGTQALWLLGESIAVNGSMGEIVADVAPAITAINRPGRRRWKCLCQCRARPEIIIMGEPHVQVTIHYRDDHLFIVCSLCTQVHNTSPSLSTSDSPFLHAAAGKARPSGSHLCSAAVAVAMALSPSRCLAQAAWVLESLLWKPERGARSKWQAEGSEGRTSS